jgi:hypothetical protein
MRRTGRLVVAARVTVVGVAVAALLTGCSATNPATIETPYPAGDGTAAELENAATGETVKLRNFLLVTTAVGAPGAVSGAIANEGRDAVQVRLTISDGRDPSTARVLGQTMVDVAGGGLTMVGPGGTRLDIPQVTVGPGRTLVVTAATTGGSTSFPLPVLAAVREYATITPVPVTTVTTAAPAPSETPSESPSATPSS